MRRFDVILFGATGFTGKNCVEVILDTLKNGRVRPFTWAVSGRNTDKLREVLDAVGKSTGASLDEIECIEADVNDYGSVCAMVRQCHVVLNTVGPYASYGEVVIRACIREKTHHVDINAEQHNLTQMQLKYDADAEDAEVYIVGSCGFDSIPVDCGMNYLQQLFPGELNSVESYLYTGTHMWSNKVNYGTWQSMVRFYAEFSKLRPLLNKLCPDPLPAPAPVHKLKQRGIHYDRVGEVGSCVPFPAPDTWTVERTQLYNFMHHGQRPVQYTGYLKQSNIFLTLAIAIGACMLWVLTKCKCGVYLLEKFPGFFSFGGISRQGPSREQMDRFKFSVTLVGRGWKRDTTTTVMDNEHQKQKEPGSEPPNETLVVKIDGVNPGYGATNICLLQAALTILEESDRMPTTGGVFTPGVAFASTTLIERLNKNGLTFSVLSETGNGISADIDQRQGQDDNQNPV